VEASTTVRVAVVYLFVLIGVIGIAGTLDGEEYMHLLSCVCFVSAIVSILLVIVSPSNAFMGGVDYQGIFPHKNFLGQVMAIGALATLHGIRVARRRQAGKFFMLFTFVGMAGASKSATALLTTLTFCGISAFFALWQRRGVARSIGVTVAVIFVPILVVAMAAPDTFLEMIGKDPTMSGRTEIWAYVIYDIAMKPWLGWGYSGFWLQPQNPAAVEISDAVHWSVPQAHNGLLEFLLSVGLVGTSIFLFLFVRTLILAYRCLRTPARALAISTIIICIGILLEGVSEPVLLNPTQPSTPVFFIAGLMCEQALRAAKRRRYRAVPRYFSLAQL
jgi:O-antigen ligase